jgi:hypothetical protein
MDDSTADSIDDAFPSPAEDFNNIRNDWASSLLDRRHRASFAWDYERPGSEGSGPFLQKSGTGCSQARGSMNPGIRDLKAEWMQTSAGTRPPTGRSE